MRRESSNDDDFSADVRRLLKERRRQGFPARISDPSILDQIVGVIQGALAARRHRRTVHVATVKANRNHRGGEPVVPKEAARTGGNPRTAA